MTSFKALLPWVVRPLVSVPPMAYVSRSELTIAVAQAGAMGFLACGYDTETFTSDLSLVLTALHSLSIPNLPSGLCPFGVGFILWTTPIEILETVFPMDGVTPHPAAIWLFAGKFEDWIPLIRDKSPETVIFIQVGSVQEAKRAREAGADVLVAQGSDAGGHGTAQSASIISLVPELVSTFPQMPILAAGGIVDARGALAALALGAEGVIMGTRFATSVESSMADKAKSVILQTHDGGVSTKRTRIYDILRGKKDWLTTHDGRAIINETLRDYDDGMAEKELQAKYDTAVKGGDYTRLVVYAGTGSGLVNKTQTVVEILDEVETQFAQYVKEVNEKLIAL